MIMPEDSEPTIAGDYELNESDSSVAVAIVGRGTVEVPDHLCRIIGTYKTENLGIEKIVANIVSRPEIRHLVVCGREEFGHYPGDALLNLHRNGVDDDMRIIGTRAPIPFLCNTTTETVDRFRVQVGIHDLVEPKEADEIIEYDPVYHFTDEERERLIDLLITLNDRGDKPFDSPPIMVHSATILKAGEGLGKGMHILSDRIVSGMLAMATERLSTTSPFITIGTEPGIILNPVDGRVDEVDSVSLAMKLRDYLTGGY